MSTTEIGGSSLRQPLRLWPGVIAALLVVVLRFLLPMVWPDGSLVGFIGALAGAIVILLWWLFFSRAPWSERLGALVVILVAAFATRPFLHKSIAGGMMGMMFAIYAIPPVLAPAFVAWAVATRRLSNRTRRVTMVATIVLACGVWTLARTEGIKGGGGAQLAWRWTKTPEERLLAEVRDEPTAPSAAPIADTAKPPVDTKPAEAPVSATPPSAPATAPVIPPAVSKPAEWPGFRGSHRDGVISGVQIATDWAASPPVQIWRRPVGPGWSSFAVRGDRLYTQEQRGEEEVVACYRVSTGEPVWRHRDPVRFWESNGGAGPRATPTLSNGRVYTFGATGILNALDERNGALLWSRNVSSDAKIKVPGWGFASSPLVVGDDVIVAASGKLAAYDAATGAPRWFGPPSGGGSYSSPHLVTIDGTPQVLLLNGAGATSVSPASGATLWRAPWESSVTIVQPAVIGNGDILVTTAAATGGEGIRRLSVKHAGAGWTADARWTSTGLKPYFNDFVVHKGYAFGFDGNILSCVDLNDGTRKWKGGRYGNGQLLLLSDQDLLLVVSEEGELALVKASPDQFTEIARIPGLDGKTWNHPVVVRDVLLVRNDREMAAFRLPLAGR